MLNRMLNALTLSLTVLVFSSTTQAAFPKRAVKLVVYTKPGGAIDVFARQFQKIAKKYTEATIVVVNKAGAGGIVALKHLLKRGGDGHTFAAVTKSNIGKIVSARSDLSTDQFNWLSMLVSDPEALIVNETSAWKDWKSVVKDAKEKKGEQIWVGPAAGGNDHIMAMKVWEKANIQAKWIPYAGGGKAITALMGGHGAVYVGNPGDILGKTNLKVIAVSKQKRLAVPFSDAPTFKELGIEGLDNEIIWRGFVAKKGISEEAEKFYTELMAKVSQDPEWRSYIEKSGADSVFIRGDEFAKVVENDRKEFKSALSSLNVVP